MRLDSLTTHRVTNLIDAIVTVKKDAQLPYGATDATTRSSGAEIDPGPALEEPLAQATADPQDHQPVTTLPGCHSPSAR